MLRSIFLHAALESRVDASRERCCALSCVQALPLQRWEAVVCWGGLISGVSLKGAGGGGLCSYFLFGRVGMLGSFASRLTAFPMHNKPGVMPDVSPERKRRLEGVGGGEFKVHSLSCKGLGV